MSEAAPLDLTESLLLATLEYVFGIDDTTAIKYAAIAPGPRLPSRSILATWWTATVAPCPRCSELCLPDDRVP